MCAFFRRPLALAVAGLAAALSGAALGQSDRPVLAQAPEEITVRGQKPLEQYRLELAAAREDIVEAYNEANSTDDNDIVCRNERVTGTRMPKRICRSKAQSRAEANAARDFLLGLLHSSGNFRSDPGGGRVAALPEGGPQVNASLGAAAAMSGGELLSAQSRAAIEAELDTLRKENRQVYRAIVRYLELEDEYDRARGVTADQ